MWCSATCAIMGRVMLFKLQCTSNPSCNHFDRSIVYIVVPCGHIVKLYRHIIIPKWKMQYTVTDAQTYVSIYCICRDIAGREYNPITVCTRRLFARIITVCSRRRARSRLTRRDHLTKAITCVYRSSSQRQQTNKHATNYIGASCEIAGQQCRLALACLLSTFI